MSWGKKKKINQSPSNKNRWCEKKCMVHSVKCLRRPRTDNVFVSHNFSKRPHTVITSLRKDCKSKEALLQLLCDKSKCSCGFHQTPWDWSPPGTMDTSLINPNICLLTHYTSCQRKPFYESQQNIASLSYVVVFSKRYRPNS